MVLAVSRSARHASNSRAGGNPHARPFIDKTIAAVNCRESPSARSTAFGGNIHAIVTHRAGGLLHD
ncbi:hypothetical protein, partial [Serratia marcescens]|uniref:hypothetical protein n=1 Tax=Serratia marcescens TaxID=615 RepID=UPI001953C000